MPSSPIEHFEYTVNEWKNQPFVQITEVLPEKLKVIYDIGANAGGFSHIMHEKYPNSKIYCFEPIKDNFECLEIKVPFAECFNKGIYYGVKQSKAYWRGSNIGAFFSEEVDAGDDKIATGEIMEMVELEELKIKKPDLIKIDIEGAEVNIIPNSKIIKNCPYIILEWHPYVDHKQFFEEHLPNHRIMVNLENKQFLLCLK